VVGLHEVVLLVLGDVASEGVEVIRIHPAAALLVVELQLLLTHAVEAKQGKQMRLPVEPGEGAYSSRLGVDGSGVSFI
jgi:predicted nuclease with RNAse H fold